MLLPADEDVEVGDDRTEQDNKPIPAISGATTVVHLPRSFHSLRKYPITAEDVSAMSMTRPKAPVLVSQVNRVNTGTCRLVSAPAILKTSKTAKASTDWVTEPTTRAWVRRLVLANAAGGTPSRPSAKR